MYDLNNITSDDIPDLIKDGFIFDTNGVIDDLIKEGKIEVIDTDIRYSGMVKIIDRSIFESKQILLELSKRFHGAVVGDAGTGISRSLTTEEIGSAEIIDGLEINNLISFKTPVISEYLRIINDEDNGLMESYEITRSMGMYNTPKRLKGVPVVDVRTEPKVGRNELCPCGSGFKNKKCCNA